MNGRKRRTVRARFKQLHLGNQSEVNTSSYELPFFTMSDTITSQTFALSTSITLYFMPSLLLYTFLCFMKAGNSGLCWVSAQAPINVIHSSNANPAVVNVPLCWKSVMAWYPVTDFHLWYTKLNCSPPNVTISIHSKITVVLIILTRCLERKFPFISEMGWIYFNDPETRLVKEWHEKF